MVRTGRTGSHLTAIDGAIGATSTRKTADSQRLGVFLCLVLVKDEKMALILRFCRANARYLRAS